MFEELRSDIKGWKAQSNQAILRLEKKVDATQQSVANLAEQVKKDRVLWKADQDSLAILSEDFNQFAGEIRENKDIFEGLKLGSIADWPTMQRLFRETYDTIEPEVGLDSFTQMSQQCMKYGVSFLQCFKIQQAKCDYMLPEQEAIKLAIRGLEHR
ncbi:hypothetical protein ACLB2K_027212 [Fragaria x ananassa]